MSLVKSWLECETLRRIKSADFDSIYLFTNEAARPINGEKNCFYQVYGDVGGVIVEIAVLDEDIDVCDCNECRWSEDLPEYLSVLSGLRHIRDAFGIVHVWLWVSSERFVTEEPTFDSANVTCTAHARILRELREIFLSQDVQVDSYHYKNKEIIPVFVDGRRVVTDGGAV